MGFIIMITGFVMSGNKITNIKELNINLSPVLISVGVFGLIIMCVAIALGCSVIRQNKLIFGILALIIAVIGLIFLICGAILIVKGGSIGNIIKAWDCKKGGGIVGETTHECQ